MILRFAWVGALLLVAACQTRPPASSPLGRPVWIDRWDWKTKADIEAAIDRAHDFGFDTVVFQVRGNGTVFFPSGIEVWAEQFGHQDPGFDPLGVAVAAAHVRGMKLCAWVNMMPGWVGVQAPGDARQLLRVHPEWFLLDAETRLPERKASKYLGLNPCLPEVRRYLSDLCREIVTRYDVDGLQLDYIRFPEPEPAGREVGLDPGTMNLFARATGRSSSDRSALPAWQRECVTRLVADVRSALTASGRRIPLSAAVFADVQVAREKVRQDWPEWCRRGLVDAVVPMNYTEDDTLFAVRSRSCVAAAGRVPVVMAIGAYKCRDAVQVRGQIDAATSAGAAGVGVFNWRALFGKLPEVTPQQQQDLRRGVETWLREVGPAR